jgi:hypothetical protein
MPIMKTEMKIVMVVINQLELKARKCLKGLIVKRLILWQKQSEIWNF